MSLTPEVSGSFVQVERENYYCIRHYDQMPPFLMSIVSGSDHWLFIASSGGLTAGRVSPDNALFPYETEDKVTASFEQTGSKTLVRVQRDGQTTLWEPFSGRYAGIYRCERHLYKHIYGHKLIFEEINHDLQLTFRYAWRTSDRFGFVRTCWLHNDGPEPCSVALLDGVQNVLPYGANQQLQTTMSSLLNGYKRSELHQPSGLALFALSATLTDRAEPSESLRATVAWQTGLDNPLTLLSVDQIDAFRRGRPLHAERDILGKPGAFLVHTNLALAAGATQQWYIVANVNQDGAAAADLARWLQTEPDTAQQLEHDIAQTGADLVRLVAAADGLQRSARTATDVHHFANVLFNIMRGGAIANGYQIDRADLIDFVRVRNRAQAAAHADWLAALPASVSLDALYARADGEAADLIRLCHEYLPLSFSRRHGDPSRPWNHFAINLRHADGSPRLDYQGNWRDIFQNWEPLALSFPHFLPGMIAKFVNATTVDGYNPYRVTRAGIEWEEPEPDNPWANIGYWSDHQIIYLQKLLEMLQQQQPGALAQLWRQPIFSTADVPYRLRPYQAMLTDWYSTVDFDHDRAAQIAERVAAIGSDGRLLTDADGNVVHVTLAEKLLVLLLAKLTNLVPGGGIWMNTQRPEWNDANNALVGKGLSVVTTAYLRRFVAFWRDLLQAHPAPPFVLSAPVATLFDAVHTILRAHAADLPTALSDSGRKQVMNALGAAITDYRATVYTHGLGGATRAIDSTDLSDLLAVALVLIDATLHANRRDDHLFHTYNTLRLDGDRAAVGRLYVMLEGQVAILSSGLLAAEESARLLQALRASDLYRADQHSYMLYPNRALPGFLAKNHVAAGQVAGLALVQALAAAGDRRLIMADAAGDFHFPGTFRNAGDVEAALDTLAREPAWRDLVAAERTLVLDLFETTFNHSAFTGRSGTFFAYEGLGSIYWHMVAKLLLAVQESYLAALAQGANAQTVAALADTYYDIRAGIGFNKEPDVYGAFPTDPYSHTPFGAGARQPGMTGQVKEEILTRFGELGVALEGGVLRFAPTLLRRDEFLRAPGTFEYIDSAGRRQTLALPTGSLAFTLCQTPVIYTLGDTAQLSVELKTGERITLAGNRLDAELSAHILGRDGTVSALHVTLARAGISAADRGAAD